jgi:hypothetical protein
MGILGTIFSQGMPFFLLPVFAALLERILR